MIFFRMFGVLGLLFILQAVYAQVGNDCKISSTGVPGTCKISTDCPKVEEQAKKGISPTICGWYQLTTPIVCCEDSNSFTQPNGLDFISFPDQEKPDISHNPTSYRRKSEEKCEEYSKTIMSFVQAIPLLTETEPININVPKCQYNSVPLIVGGKPAGQGEFPFMAALGYDVDNQIEWKCGGTLISDRFVLTAAHCTFSRDYGPPSVARLGDLDLTDDGTDHADYPITSVITHPDYQHSRKYNDIALLKLNRKVRITQYIRPACLYFNKRIDETKAVATGYGATSFGDDFANKLMKVALNIYDKSKCAIYSKDKGLPQGFSDSLICAGELQGRKDTCQGDSGGPLLVTQKDNLCLFYVVGITAFGKGCGMALPAVYTRVSEFVPWIEENVWP